MTNTNPLMQLVQLLTNQPAMMPSIPGMPATTPPFMPAAPSLPAPIVPPAVAPQAQPAPAKKKGVMSRLTDPKTLAVLSSAASNLVRPRQQGESEMGQFVNAITGGYGTLAAVNEYQRQQAAAAGQQQFENVAKVEGLRQGAQGQNTQASSVENQNVNRTAGTALEGKRVDVAASNAATAEQSRLDDKEAKAATLAFQKEIKADEKAYRDGQLAQASAELAEKRRQFNAGQIDAKAMAAAERSNRVHIATINNASSERMNFVRTSIGAGNAADATSVRNDIALQRQAEDNVKASLNTLEGMDVSPEKRLLMIQAEYERLKASTGASASFAAPTKTYTYDPASKTLR